MLILKPFIGIAMLMAISAANTTQAQTMSPKTYTTAVDSQQQLTLQELMEKSDTHIEDAIMLPIARLAAVSDNKGSIMFISDSGRYAIQGSLVDLWEGEILTTMPEIRKSVATLDLYKPGLEIDKLNVVTLGSGEREIVVFVDPVCPTCIQLIEDAQELAEQYTFKFLVVPALGGQSNDLSKQIFCAAEPEKKLDALKNQTIAQLAVKEKCPLDYYDQTLMVAHMLSINGVPFIISQKDKQFRGRPADLKQWLEQN